MKPLYILIISLLVFTTACGVSSRKATAPQKNNGTKVDGKESMKSSLMQAYRDWKGVPYLLGGASPDGVDCSSFTSIVLDEYFDVDIPVTTRKQLAQGKEVRRKSIQTGDLVFFRTGRSTLHVGILVNSTEFMHASTSSGVMISDIREPYWASKYLGARRVM